MTKIEIPENALFEHTDLRTINSKTFQLDSSQRRLIIKHHALHIPDDIPMWQAGGKVDIWHDAKSILKKQDQQYVQSGITWYDCNIDTKNVGYRYKSKRMNGEVVVQLVALDDVLLENLIINCNPIIKDDNSVLYADFVSGLDFIIETYMAKVEIFKIIKDPSAPHKFTWDVLIKDNSGIKRKTSTNGIDNLDKLETSRPGDLKRRRILVDIEREEIDSTRHLFHEIVSRKTVYIDPITRVRKLSDDIIYPLEIDDSTSEDIVHEDDDGHIMGAYWYVVGGLSGVGRDHCDRFQTVAVPQGATVTSATLTYQSLYGLNNLTAKTYGEDVDDAAQWTNLSKPTFTKTTHYHNVTLTSGAGVKELDITDCIQEIVNRDGWLSGQDMRIGIFVSAGAGNHYIDDYPGANCSDLDITYTAGGRTTHNTDAFPLGQEHGIAFRM